MKLFVRNEDDDDRIVESGVAFVAENRTMFMGMCRVLGLEIDKYAEHDIVPGMKISAAAHYDGSTELGISNAFIPFRFRKPPIIDSFVQAPKCSDTDEAIRELMYNKDDR